MYRIKCDGYTLYDPRDDEFILINPKCKLQVNTVGEGSFTILPNHPYYDKLQRLKSIFEIYQDDQVIFRGRMTGDNADIHNRLTVDLEGVLGFTNDTIIPPFNFPDDFEDATSAKNIVQYFLQWILNQHNDQSEEWQHLKLGKVTVSDPNNYINRSSKDYASTWSTLKSKLFDSTLGGYLIIRYEDDGNYVDYVSEFEKTNSQHIVFGENILNITSKSDADETYSAILPMGKDGLTLKDLPDGNITDDLIKKGLFIYSKSAVSDYGWICAPVSDSKWDDITTVENLKKSAVDYMTGTATFLSSTITIKALDLSFTNDQIQSFRIYQNILVDSPMHGVKDVSYPLTKLDIDILKPQNTTITIGDTVRTLVSINQHQQGDTVSTSDVDIQSIRNEVQNKLDNQSTEIIEECNSAITAALETYVKTSNFEEYQETVSLALQNFSDQFTSLYQQITVNKDGFNIRVPLSINGTEIDYIVEQGETDGWFYRKWNSGYAECWKIHYASVNSAVTNYSGFYYSGTVTVPFPFTFTNLPTVTVDGGSNTYMNFVRTFGKYSDAATYVVVSLMNAGTVNVTVDIKAIGRWK